MYILDARLLKRAARTCVCPPTWGAARLKLQQRRRARCARLVGQDALHAKGVAQPAELCLDTGVPGPAAAQLR